MREWGRRNKKPLVQHGVNQPTIQNGAKAQNIIFLTFDFRVAVPG